MVFLTPQLLRAVGLLFSAMVSGWVGSGKKFILAVSQRMYGVGSCYLVGTLVRCAMSWCDLDLIFDLTIVTLTYKILSRLYLGNRKV